MSGVKMWQPIETVPEKEQVLLRWTYDDTDDIVRIGELLYKPYGDAEPLFKLELDYGDAFSTIYTGKSDVPTHWMHLP